MAASGYLSLNGDTDREPVKPYGDQALMQGGLHAALGIVTSLYAGDRGGTAPEVDASATEAAGSLIAGALQRWHAMDRPQRRNGPRPASFDANRLYPSTVRPCADGHVHVHCHNRFHDLISILMESPRLREPDVLDTPLGHADEIDAAMDAWLSTRTRREAVAAAQELRVPMTEVFSPAEVLANESGHLTQRGFFVDMQHPEVGSIPQPGAPVRLPASPWRNERAPRLGEDNIAVFCDELGLTRRQLAQLTAAGVV
jgi:crotonobetainyl-CoA:carnitine CoA-transferase CaiB-like acyl-CoA transferase